MRLPAPTNLTGRGQDDGSWALRSRADSIDHPRMASSCGRHVVGCVDEDVLNVRGRGGWMRWGDGRADAEGLERGMTLSSVGCRSVVALSGAGREGPIASHSES